MCYAIIDLGSNTIRLCVYDYADGVINTIVNQKETGGLAGYVTSGILSQDGIEKACEILNAHIALAKKLVDKSNIHILATASLRNIDNREEAAEAIYRKTEMLPEVLTGEEEALLDFIGASYHINYQRGLLINIGGASTELVLFDNHEPVALASMPVGCLTLYRKYVDNIFPSQEEEKQIKKEVLRFLQETNLQKGEVGSIIIKCNSLTDLNIIEKLIEASRSGVKVTMIIRGICCLIPQVKNYTENIKVISIIGRFLEHSRVFCFGTGPEMEVFISSADLMTRNTERRVEVACPIYDPELKAKTHKILEYLMEDNTKAWELLSSGEYNCAEILCVLPQLTARNFKFYRTEHHLLPVFSV